MALTGNTATTFWQQLASCFSTSNLQLFLLIGSGLLVIALLFISLTKWGQARPVWKCVILSVMAHILLIGYAYGTRLIFEVPTAKQESTPIRVNFVEDNGADIEPDPSEFESNSQPWNEFAEQQPSAEREELPRPEINSEFNMERVVSVDEPEFESTPRSLPDVVQEPLQMSSNDNGFRIPKRDSTELAPEQISNSRQKPESPSRPDIEAGDGFQNRKMVEYQSTTDQDNPANENPIAQDIQTEPKTVPFESDLVAQESSLPLAEPTLPPSSLPGDSQFKSDSLPAIASLPIESNMLMPLEPRVVATESPQSSDEISPSDVATVQTPANATEPDQPEPNQQLVNPANPKNKTEFKLISSQRRLGDGQKMPKLYALRDPEKRLSTARRRGGSIETEQAVEASLKWLANNQDEDGRWDPRKHQAGRETRTLGHDRQGAGANADTGITALAVLAFMAAGHTHLEGPYQGNVQKGLEFILRNQSVEGELAGNAKLFARMYCHSMSLLAISEALALTGDQRLVSAVQRGVDYSVRAQNYHDGSWRYRPGDPGDMSQFGWQVLALHSAKLAGATIPKQTFDRMRTFLARCTNGPGKGLSGYRPGEGPTATMTAEALVCRYFLQENVAPVTHSTATNFVLQELPSSDHVNLYYWYYGTLATYHAGGKAWDKWNVRMKDALIKSQVQHGNAAGSWQPNGMWAGYGGRVYSTAVATLCLEVYYRYLPMYETAPSNQ